MDEENRRRKLEDSKRKGSDAMLRKQEDDRLRRANSMKKIENWKSKQEDINQKAREQELLQEQKKRQLLSRRATIDNFLSSKNAQRLQDIEARRMEAKLKQEEVKRRREQEEAKKLEAKAKRISERKPIPFQITRSKSSSGPYKVDESDPLDVMLGQYLAFAPMKEKIHRISTGQYMFGNVKVLLRTVNGNIVARIGGGWIKLEDYLQRHDQASTRIYHMERRNSISGYGTLRVSGTQTPSGSPKSPVVTPRTKKVLVRSFSAEKVHESQF
eukprot:TRINITY_DN3525_c0_g1_i6.p2 TRINITY_DN3525_c0_g1~~TRINITY_DN3525_c0_g1_i6.p2  ORF type:complete len:271 (-),score=93.67 TRINITY_DN3525_c0_g1_i6:36-848(-)